MKVRPAKRFHLRVVAIKDGIDAADREASEERRQLFTVRCDGLIQRPALEILKCTLLWIAHDDEALELRTAHFDESKLCVCVRNQERHYMVWVSGVLFEHLVQMELHLRKTRTTSLRRRALP